MFNINELSQKLVSSYQKKVSNYDKLQNQKQWNSSDSIEKHILSRTENITQLHRNSTSSSAQHSSSTNTSWNHHSATASSFYNSQNIGSSSLTSSHNYLTATTTLTTSSQHGHGHDLIDLDLISGSAFKTKPSSQPSWFSSLGHACIRVIFYPIYLKWWSHQTSPGLASLLFLAYILQITSLRLYYDCLNLLPVQNFSSNNVNSSPIISFLSNNSSISTTSFFISSSSSLSSSSSSSSSSISSSSSDTTFASSQCSSTSGSGNGSFNSTTDVPPSEVLLPIAMMIILSVLHTQIVGTKVFSSKKTASSTSITTATNIIKKVTLQEQQQQQSQQKNNKECERKNSFKITDSIIRFQQQHQEFHHSGDDSADSSYISCDSQEITDKKDESGYFATDHSSFSSQTSSPSTSVERNRSRNSLKLQQNREKESIKIFLDSQEFVDDNVDDDRYDDGNAIIDGDKEKDKKKYENDINSSKTIISTGHRLRNDSIGRRNSQSETFKKRMQALRRRSKEPLICRRALFDLTAEGNRSPITPVITALQGEDWPMIDSDGNTSCDSYEESNQPPVSGTNKNSGNSAITKPIQRNMDNRQNIHHSSGVSNCSSMSSDTTTSNCGYRRAKTGQKQEEYSGEFTVSCALWKNNAWQTVDLSVMDVNSTIIRKVDSVEHSCEYIFLGAILSIIISLFPTLYRWQNAMQNASGTSNDSTNETFIQIDLSSVLNIFIESSFLYSKSLRIRAIIYIAIFERLILSSLYFFLLCVAERTFKQRYLYSKYFSQMTRRDRAQKSQVPYFRLNKVSYLKVWLSVRAYLRKHGPMRSVDTICSYSFILAVVLLFCNSLQLLKANSGGLSSQLIFWEMMFWSLAIGIYIMRLMILGSRINRKYRGNLSVLITEQINLHLQLERKPQKKEQLMLVNHVLKLAADLLKELEAPYKISGICANSYLYNVTRVVVLSAFSALLTEMLGFKLKLDKINLIK